MDNLNIHCRKSLTDYFGEQEGGDIWDRLSVHYTPKHGSWLDPAEIEASLISRECLGTKRVATLAELRARVRHWNRRADRERRKIRWRFKTADARRVFKYRRRSTTPRSRH